MLILMSDGAGLTSRQTATVLARAGHEVEALSPRGLCLGRMTRHVRRVHDVPPVGRDPFGWLEAALAIAAQRGAGLLLPVQEQVAVMALGRDRIEAAGLATAVPSFEALAQVQDKVSAFRTLARIGVPQPPAVIAASAAELADAADRLEAGAPATGEGTPIGLPAFVKTPIGTALAGVRRVSSPQELRRLVADWDREGAFGRSRTGCPARGPTSCCWRCSGRRRGDSGGTWPVAALATLISPPAWRRFVGGSAGAYSLTPAAWGELTTTARALIAPGP